MNITPDYLIERKRTKSQLIKWKVVALVLLMIILFISGNSKKISTDTLSQKSLIAKDYIAVVRIEDVIFDNFKRDKKLARLENDDKAKALVVHINSQGGGVVASEMLYNILRKIAQKKPVVVVMDSVAASGGYLVALAGDYIIAHNGTLTGSIGVIMQTAEVTELAEKLGIQFNNFKSGKLKAAPNPTEKLTEEARQVTMDSIYSVYDYFIEVVAERRKLDIDYVKKIADGRAYSARDALELKLIDEIGTEDTALLWLQKKRGISDKLELVEFPLKNKDKLIDILLEDFDVKIQNIFSSSFKGVKSII